MASRQTISPYKSAVGFLIESTGNVKEPLPRNRRTEMADTTGLVGIQDADRQRELKSIPGRREDEPPTKEDKWTCDG